MAVRYECCVCDEDVTAEVLAACSSGPDTRALLTTAAVFKGRVLTKPPRLVMVTCSKGHQCEYPCFAPAASMGSPGAGAPGSEPTHE